MSDNKSRRGAMPEQPPGVRKQNFLEVPLGYTPEMVQAEAARCIQCKKPKCVEGCPVGVQIPEFLKLICDGDFAGAAQKVKETNALPAVCGRVCPQETQCEILCILGKKSEPVAIGRCERFVGDWEREKNSQSQTTLAGLTSPARSNTKIAVVGAGPAGLTVAGDLILLGYNVTVFEAFHKPGGVLMYGIPEFRLPKSIVQDEIDGLVKLGVKIELNQVIGQTITVDELLEEGQEGGGFAAVFIGVGAGLPMFLGLPGEDLNGIYSANEYLTRTNLMKAYLFPEVDTPIARGKNVCVIGGGNVAMDAARTAIRLGAENVKIVYRRSRTELPARLEEIHHAEEEGVEFFFLTNPKAYLDDGQGKVRAMVCNKMELGEPDASGRRRPVVIPDSEFELKTDCVIVAAGGNANPLLTKNTPGLELNKWGNIVADEKGRTSRKNVWAGGDIVTGSATVIEAMGAGRIAAQDIHQNIQNRIN